MISKDIYNNLNIAKSAFKFSKTVVEHDKKLIKNLFDNIKNDNEFVILGDDDTIQLNYSNIFINMFIRDIHIVKYDIIDDEFYIALDPTKYRNDINNINTLKVILEYTNIPKTLLYHYYINNDLHLILEKTLQLARFNIQSKRNSKVKYDSIFNKLIGYYPINNSFANFNYVSKYIWSSYDEVNNIIKLDSYYNKNLKPIHVYIK